MGGIGSGRRAKRGVREVDGVEEYWCSRCTEWKPVSEYARRSGQDRVQVWCRACNNEYQRQRRAEMRGSV